MSTFTSSSPDDLDADAEERSSALPRLGRRGWVLTAIGLAVLIGGAVWWGLGFARQEVRWQNVGFSIDSAQQATVTYDVFFYGDKPAQCHLQALTKRFAEVGVATVTVDPANGDEQRLTHTLTTTEEATTAIVDYCEIAP